MKKLLISIVIIISIVVIVLTLNRKKLEGGNNTVSDENRRISFNLSDSAEKLLNRNQTEKVEGILLNSIDLNPNNAEAYNDLAALKNKLNFPKDTVIYYYELSKRISPQYIVPYLNLAYYYFTQGDMDNVISEVNELTNNANATTKKDTSEISLAYCFMAEAKIELHRANDAIPDINKAILYDPLNDYAYQLFGTAYLYIGEYQKAIVCETIALQLDVHKKATVKYNARAIGYRMLHKYDMALKDYDTSLNYVEIFPENMKIGYYNRGLLYMDMKRYKDALVDLKIADSLGHPDVKDSINKIQSILNQTQKNPDPPPTNPKNPSLSCNYINHTPLWTGVKP